MRAAVSAVVLALGACGGASTPPLEEPPIPQAPAGTDREAMKRETALVEDMTARACACKDAACWAGIDQELRTYFRETATFNDPVEDLETWPADLDARARRAFNALAECMIEQGQDALAFGVIAARMTADFRDAACACGNADCARRVQDKREDMIAEMGGLRADEETLTEIRTASQETAACLEKHLGSPAQQAILDLKVLRRDACDCADAACAEDVQARFDAFLVDHERTQGNPAEAEEIGELAGQMSECLRAVFEAAP